MHFLHEHISNKHHNMRFFTEAEINGSLSLMLKYCKFDRFNCKIVDYDFINRELFSRLATQLQTTLAPKMSFLK